MPGGLDDFTLSNSLTTNGANGIAGITIFGAGGRLGVLNLGLMAGGVDDFGGGITTARTGISLDAVFGASGRSGYNAIAIVMAQSVDVVVLVGLAGILVAGMQSVALFSTGRGHNSVGVGVLRFRVVIGVFLTANGARAIHKVVASGLDDFTLGNGLTADGADGIAGITIFGASGFLGVLDLGLMTGGLDDFTLGNGLAADGANGIAGITILGAGGFLGVLNLGLMAGGVDDFGGGITTARTGISLDAVFGASGRSGYNAIAIVMAQSVDVVVLVGLAGILVAGMQSVALFGTSRGHNSVSVGVLTVFFVRDEKLYGISGIRILVVIDTNSNASIVAENICLVAAGSHPHGDELLSSYIPGAVGNVFTSVAIFAGNGGREAGAIRTGVAEVGGNFLGTDVCGILNCSFGFKSFQTVFDSLIVGQTNDISGRNIRMRSLVFLAVGTAVGTAVRTAVRILRRIFGGRLILLRRVGARSGHLGIGASANLGGTGIALGESRSGRCGGDSGLARILVCGGYGIFFCGIRIFAVFILICGVFAFGNLAAVTFGLFVTGFVGVVRLAVSRRIPFHNGSGSFSDGFVAIQHNGCPGHAKDQSQRRDGGNDSILFH